MIKINLFFLENILFKFTRLFAIGSSLIALIVIIVLISSLLNFKDSTHVSFEEIHAKNRQIESTLEQEQVLPVAVKRYITDEEQKLTLKGWLDSISDYDGKKDLLDNLSEVIVAAENKDVNVFEVINNYKEMKFSKLNKSKTEDGYMAKGLKLVKLFFILCCAFFIALMSLILIVLSIERNTK